MKKTSLIKTLCASVSVLTPAVVLSTVSCNKSEPVGHGEIPIEDLIIENKALLGLKPNVDVSKYDTLKVPKEVVEISRNAFANFEGKISLPKNVKNIVFEEGTDILYIAPYAFQSCKYVTNIKFANRIEFVDERAFDSCKSLKVLDFSSWKDKMSSVSPFAEANVFANCPAKGKVIVPEGCEEKAYLMLSGTGLDSDWFDFQPTIITSEQTNSYYYVDPEGNYCLTGLINPLVGNKVTDEGLDESTYVIPSGYNKIAPRAFYQVFDDLYYGEIRHIEFEEGSLLEEIGFSAFSSNKKLETIDLSKCTNLKKIDVAAFYGRENSSLEKVILPDDTVEEIGAYAFYGNGTAQQFEVNISKTKITKIGVGAFANCKHMTTLNIPNTVKWISALAISGNQELVEVNIPGQIEYIGANAFAGCYNIQNVEFPTEGSLKYIGDKAFMGCNILKFVIPSSVTYVGDAVLASNVNLETIESSAPGYQVSNNGLLFRIVDSQENIGQVIAATRTFDWIFVKDGLPLIESINQYTFYGFSVNADFEIHLESTILKSIGSSAFRDIKAGEGKFNVLLPTTVEKINDYAFQNSDVYDIMNIDKLTNVSFGIYVFDNCKKLNQIYIPNNVTEIPNYTFQHCTEATKVTIPSSVKKINRQAFWGCNKVKDLYLETFDEVPNWTDTTAFSHFGVSNLTCHIKDLSLKDKWIVLFKKLKVNVDGWQFTIPNS